VGQDLDYARDKRISESAELVSARFETSRDDREIAGDVLPRLVNLQVNRVIGGF